MVCPRKILSGTMSGFVMRSLYTRAWKIWIEPSSDEDANSGYVGWKCTARSARVWYLATRRVSVCYHFHSAPFRAEPRGDTPENFVWFVA